MSRFVLCAFLTALLTLPVAAQSADDRATTEARLRELQDQIQADQERLSVTEQAEEATLKNLNDLNRQIALREELVGTYQRRMLELRAEGDSLRSLLGTLEADIGELRGEYQRRALHAYKYGRQHDLALILGAESINQMLVRVRYLHRFTAQRRGRLALIEEATDLLEERRTQLREMLAENEQLLAEAEEERTTLGKLKRDRQSVISDLRRQRTSLEQAIQTKRATASQLESRIQELIAAESVRRREREAIDPAEAAAFAELSGSFRQNRGRLPWPVSGVVQEPFGEIVNPVYGTTTPNPGVLIATKASAEVRSVFEGSVISVDVMPDFGTYVIVEHGDYLTVYGNFSLLYVGEGDRVQAGQVIGRAGTDAEPKGPGLFFGLFNEGQAVDPTSWLRRR